MALRHALTVRLADDGACCIIAKPTARTYLQQNSSNASKGDGEGTTLGVHHATAQSLTHALLDRGSARGADLVEAFHCPRGGLLMGEYGTTLVGAATPLGAIFFSDATRRNGARAICACCVVVRLRPSRVRQPSAVVVALAAHLVTRRCVQVSAS